MPNHVHAIIRIGYGEDAETSPSEGNLFQRSPNPYMRANPSCHRHITVLSRYVSSFKGAVTKYAKSIGLNFGWQPRYHDHFIRGAQDGNNIYEYIVDNVARWDKDCYRHRNESSLTCRDAPSARIRRMPQEDGFHIIHRKAMSVQFDTFLSPACRDAPLARIRRRHKELVFISYIAKRCPYKRIRYDPSTLWRV